MQLKQNTDYALRVLMYVARSKEPQVSSREISEAYGISYSHTVKIVNKLGKLGYLALKRGRYGGGISMAAEPETINLAAVVRQFETNFDMVECFNSDTNTCVLDGRCRLKNALRLATEAFLDSLAETTLADLIHPK